MLLFFGADGPFQRDLPVLGDHLHVVSVSGKALVRLNGLSNLLSELTIGTIVLLLICSRFAGVVWPAESCADNKAPPLRIKAPTNKRLRAWDFRFIHYSLSCVRFSVWV